MHTVPGKTAARSGFALAPHLALGGLLLMLTTASNDGGLPTADVLSLAIAFFAAASWTVAAWGPGRTLVSPSLCACRLRRLRLFGLATSCLAALALWLSWSCEGAVLPLHVVVLAVLVTLSVGARCRIRGDVHEKLLFNLPLSSETLR